tara:strand:+ start:2274 stop:2897 length:624 start_codon:yes stop_codon:yes gene_type:complete
MLEKIGKYLDDNFLHLAEQKSVLEFGPAWGWMSYIISNRNPSDYTIVEPSSECIESLRKFIDDTREDRKLFELTYNDYYSLEKKHFDLVLCCGLLYHLHSPIDLLEKIVNYNTPELLLVTNIEFSETHLSSEIEPVNEVLMRYSDSDISNPINRNLCISRNDIQKCLTSVGYELVDEITPEKFNSLWNRDSEGIKNYLLLFKKQINE